MRRVSAALALLTLILIAAPARADESDFPSVTINTITSKGRCWDGWPGCFRPDFFVIVRLRNAQGQEIKCPASPVIEELLSSSPNVTLCNPVGGPATPPISIRRPYSVIVELWDADGNPPPGSPPGTPSTTAAADQADLDNGAANDASIGPFIFSAASSRAFVIDGPDAVIGLTVDTAPVPSKFTFGPSLSAMKIDPAIGEDVVISGRLDDPTPLTISATEINTGAITVIAQLVPTDNFDIRWDGRTAPGGPLMPSGNYRIDVAGRSGANWSSPLTLAPRPPLTFGSPRLETPPAVNVHAIFPRVSVSVPELTDVTMQVERRSSFGCSGVVLQKIAFPSLRPGRHVLEWDGRTSLGTWAPPGPNCLRLVGRRVSDNAGYVGTPTLFMDVEPQRPLFVDVRASPEIPALSPGAPVRVVARVFDDLGALRPARFIRISAGDFPSLGKPLAFLGSCTETSECSFALPGGVASGTAALSAQAEDAGAELLTFSSLRLVDLLAVAGSDIRVSVAATSDGSAIVETTRRRAIDVVFHRSIDFRSDDPSSPGFPALFGQHMDAILGYGFTRRGPSVMEANLPSTNFWAVAAPATVEHTQSPENPADPSNPNNPDNLCRITSASWSNSADVNGVLHLQNCRDNAPSGAYSVKAYSSWISWHELHHAPFDLADEYCCDGGYWLAASLPNVYPSLNDCQSFGSDPATCHMVSRQVLVGTVPTTLTSTPPWFVSDPSDNDVMTGSFGRQNADDARKVRARYFTCTAGGC